MTQDIETSHVLFFPWRLGFHLTRQRSKRRFMFCQTVNSTGHVSASDTRTDRIHVWKTEPISFLCMACPLTAIQGLMEEPLLPARSSQLRSGGVGAHTHYLPLTTLCCSSSQLNSLFLFTSFNNLCDTLFFSICLFLFFSLSFREGKRGSSQKCFHISRPTENNLCACKLLKIYFFHALGTA